MSIEIERKFLVNSADYKNYSFKNIYIKQGFLNSNKHRVVRVRLTDNKGYLTIKGKSFDKGTSRFEWEKVISKKEAENLLVLCEYTPIEKKRYYVKNGEFTFEIDEFFGDNEGLVIAELELKTKNDTFNKPLWLGKEVTGKKKYYNARLSHKPFSTWNKKSSKQT